MNMHFARFNRTSGLQLTLFIDFFSQKRSQRICVETSGQHEIHLINSCISFGSPSVLFDTANPMVRCFFPLILMDIPK
jgi:hypothetical protein